MNRHRARMTMLLCGIVLLTGCGKFRWKKQDRHSFMPYTKASHDLSVSLYPLDDTESKKQFKVNPRRRGYQPLHLYVDNMSDDYYVLHPWYIKVPLIPPKQVARDFYTDVPTAVGFMAFLGWFGVMWFSPLSYFLPAAILAVFSLPQDNRKKKKSLSRNGISRGIESIVIPPGGFMERYLFVKAKDLDQPFSITIHNQRTNKPEVFPFPLLRENDTKVS